MRHDEHFGGTIGRTLADSTPWWPTPAHPRVDAPNVVVILLDDLGFSHLGCFGSDLTTPNIDALAIGGLRYSNFHVTPLCSPTRAALLTGRNHHSVGMRGVSNWSSGFPSMRGQVSHHAATMAEVLREDGYTTFALGKWHLVSMENSSSAGPFDQWPLARGFDRFYGFLDGETDQFSPDLIYDNHRVAPPRDAQAGYHLSEDLVDKSLEFIHDSKSLRPDRPFFTYLAFGATHAPHQAPPSYLAKHRGRYDDGWDAARDRWFARQRAMDLLPASTTLAPRNEGVEAWSDLPESHRRLASRLQEAFAAFLEHTDAQIGRFVDGLRELGELDNTLLMVMSDNGASQEGGPFGILHEMKYFNFILESPDDAAERLDDIGGPASHANYPWGWAQAGNTPFKWYKQNTHEGGVHVPLVVHWPRGIAARGEIRHEFRYVTDVAPTIFDVVGTSVPDSVRGFAQMPLAGSSMRASFDGTDETGGRARQYFEMVGHRAMYDDGWKAVTRHVHGVDFDDDRWELYHVAIDPSECEDLAVSKPEKLAELVAAWWEDAEHFGVLPLDDRTLELFAARFSDYSVHPLTRHYTYRPPMSPIPPQAAPAIGGRSWDLDARVVRHAHDEGVLMATGNENSGLTLFVQDERLVFDYNVFGEHYVLRSTTPLSTGPSTLGVRFRRRGGEAHVTLHADDVELAAVDLPFVMRFISSSPTHVGHDGPSSVSNLYEGAFPFRGTIDRVDIRLVSREDAEQQTTAAREGMARQ